MILKAAVHNTFPVVSDAAARTLYASSLSSNDGGTFPSGYFAGSSSSENIVGRLVDSLPSCIRSLTSSICCMHS